MHFSPITNYIKFIFIIIIIEVIINILLNYKY